MKTYQQHLTSTLAYGETVSLTRKPVFRSSAIFPVLHDPDVSARILFMGYWLLKRGIPEVQLLVTLRAETGTVLIRKSLLVDSARAYAIEIDGLLAESGADSEVSFIGSVELEIFSTRDLVFPYPAFVLNYLGDTFVTSVHTAGRAYNDIDDFNENDVYEVPESGFDVYASAAIEPFAAFVNGPYSYEAPAIGWVVTDAHERATSGTFTLGTVLPYQTVFLHLAELLPLEPLLGGEKGAVTLSHRMKGFFPRMIAGNRLRHSPGVSITHSYYDSSAISDAGAYWSRTGESVHDSSIFVPVFAEGDQYTELVFYPIYSPSAFDVGLVFHAADGTVLAEARHWMELSTAPDRLLTISLSEVVRRYVPADLVDRVQGINVVKNWRDRSRIPTRLKFGLNVGLRNRMADLPTNICFNSELGNPAVLDKSRSFRWSPILNQGRSVLVFINSSTLKHYERSANLELRFYRQLDASCLERRIKLPPFGQHRIDLPEDPELLEFLAGFPGWVTTTSDNPLLKAWYFDFAESGVVAGDHSF